MANLSVLFILPILCMGAALLIYLRGRPNISHPTCGHCGYDLTASTSNRCPECGKLFIEAGVQVGVSGRPMPRKQALVVLLVLGLLIPAGIGAVGVLMVARQRAARSQARAALLQTQAAKAQADAAQQTQAILNQARLDAALRRARKDEDGEDNE